METNAPIPDPAERLVQVDGRTIPVRVWEQELTLRCAAWCAIVQAAIVASWPLWGFHHPLSIVEWWRLGACAALLAAGLLLVRSRPLKAVLVAVLVGLLLALALDLGAGVRSGFSYRSWRSSLSPLFPALIGVGAGVLLIFRRPIGRDLLLILSFAWLMTVTPRVYMWAYPSFPDSFGHWSGPTAGGRDTLGALVVLLPTLFILATMLTAPGRCVLSTATETSRLAPLSSLFRLGAARRAWVAAGALAATTVLSLLRAETLSRLFGSPW